MPDSDGEIPAFSPEDNSSESYRVIERVTEGEGFTIDRAEETTIGAPCFIHRMNCGTPITPHQAHATINLLKRFGALNQPRTPRLADAWIEEKDVVAVEYRPDVDTFDLADSNPLLRGRGLTPGAVAQGSLDTVSALHFCGIIHGGITWRCWGVGPGNRIYLVDTSLDRTIVNCLEEMAVETNPTLSTNLFTRDVACWAYAMISMMLGHDLVPDVLDEKWDSYYHRQAEDEMNRCIKKEKVRDFFRNCLTGFGPMPSVYDTGLEALKAFKSAGLKEEMS